MAVLSGLALFIALQASASQSGVADHTALRALEISSHQRWLAGDLAELSRIMSPEFRFVVMNGAVERREDVIGPRDGRKGPPALSTRSIAVHPDEIIVQNDTAIVISTMNIDATVNGRPLSPLMRVLSVFTRSGNEWKLLARSITPVRQRQAQP